MTGFTVTIIVTLVFIFALITMIGKKRMSLLRKVLLTLGIVALIIVVVFCIFFFTIDI